MFIYAITFTLLDLIHERLGKHGARQVIGTAFCANLLLAAYAQLTVWWPAPAFFDGQDAVARVLGATPRIVGASLVAYLVASLVDAEIFAWWRARVGGYRWGRVLVSNAVSTAVDSLVFVTLAFAGVLPILPLVVGQYILKMAVTVVSLPLIYGLRAGNGRAAPRGAAALGDAVTRVPRARLGAWVGGAALSLLLVGRRRRGRAAGIGPAPGARCRGVDAVGRDPRARGGRGAPGARPAGSAVRGHARRGARRVGDHHRPGRARGDRGLPRPGSRRGSR